MAAISCEWRGVGGRSPQRDPGAERLDRGSGGPRPPEAEKKLNFDNTKRPLILHLSPKNFTKWAISGETFTFASPPTKMLGEVSPRPPYNRRPWYAEQGLRNDRASVRPSLCPVSGAAGRANDGNHIATW